MALESLEQLPDDVLLIVMQNLSVQSLFNCRLVCKRLADLALHPDVWRHRDICYKLQSNAAAVLLLAPCLDTLYVTAGDPIVSLTSTRCAVAKLHLDLDLDFEGRPLGNATEYAFVVRNQEALGRLRTLSLQISSSQYANDALMRTVAQCSNLESLEILGTILGVTYPIKWGQFRSSLKRFECPLDSESQPFVNTILTIHAATLERVDLRWGSVENDTTARLLGAMSNLQNLSCEIMPGMEAVAACASLRILTISPCEYMSSEVADLAKFLRLAHQLKDVELDRYDMEFCPEVAAVLLQSLTASGRSRVEKLTLTFFEEVRPLYGRLHMLPALRHLSVTEAELDDALLRSITPETAPTLRLLELGATGGACSHAWLHRGAVVTVLAQNPSLHIVLWGKYDCDLQDCEACSRDCHQEVARQKAGPLRVYSHDEHKCPCPEYHSTVSSWIHIGSNST